MPEIVLELSLNRSSGVLAGIVASLAQAGIELKSQKLQRATEGRSGRLTIVGSGDSPDPAVLAERFNATRGVEKLMRVIVDGETVLAEAKPLKDQTRRDDLAELSAGSGSVTHHDMETPESSPSGPSPSSGPAPDHVRDEHAGGPDIEDLPILSEPEILEETPAEPEPDLPAEAPEVDADPFEQDLQRALGSGEEHRDDAETPEFASDPSTESDLAAALYDAGDSDQASAPGDDDKQDNDAAQVGAILRRRRRRWR